MLINFGKITGFSILLTGQCDTRPSSINMYPEVPLRDWVSEHNSQEHAYEEYDKVVKAIRGGKEYVATNIS